MCIIYTHTHTNDQSQREIKQFKSNYHSFSLSMTWYVFFLGRPDLPAKSIKEKKEKEKKKKNTSPKPIPAPPSRSHPCTIPEPDPNTSSSNPIPIFGSIPAKPHLWLESHPHLRLYPCKISLENPPEPIPIPISPARYQLGKNSNLTSSSQYRTYSSTHPKHNTQGGSRLHAFWSLSLQPSIGNTGS